MLYMSKPRGDSTDENSLFDEIDVDSLLQETPDGDDAKEMAERNK